MGGDRGGDGGTGGGRGDDGGAKSVMAVPSTYGS
jgi:hypothetical protein